MYVTIIDKNLDNDEIDQAFVSKKLTLADNNEKIIIF